MALGRPSEPAGVELRRGVDLSLRCPRAQTGRHDRRFIEQKLGNHLPFEKPIATILTMTEVDADDPAMADPTKFVGPACSRINAGSGCGLDGPGGTATRRRVVPLRSQADLPDSRSK